MTPRLSGVIVTPSTVKGSVENNAGNRLTSWPRTIRTPARSICPTATVARITVMTGAMRSGRNATRSTAAPAAPVMITAARTAGA